LNSLQSQNKAAFFRSISDDVFLTEEIANGLSSIEGITFIGYPRGISDQKNNLPIIRQGITSTPIWNKFNDKPVFLIDASSFPGSSGSPVFIYNQGMYSQGTNIVAGTRIYYCGILTETLKHKSDEGNEYLNLGVVVNAIKIASYINETIQIIQGA
jgi:V8-like Glu-specific endopeptidase